MANVAAEASGAAVITASSRDARHPPQTVLDGDAATFWVTTGMFPQELIIRLAKQGSVRRVEVVSRKVNQLEILSGSGPSPSKWEPLCQQGLADDEGRRQVTSMDCSGASVSHIKLRITSGFDDFAVVHSVIVES